MKMSPVPHRRHILRARFPKTPTTKSNGHHLGARGCPLDSVLFFCETVLAKCVSCVGLVTFSSSFARSQTKYGRLFENRAGLLELLQNITATSHPRKWKLRFFKKTNKRKYYLLGKTQQQQMARFPGCSLVVSGCSLAAPWPRPGCSLAAPWLLLAPPGCSLAAPGCSWLLLLAAPGCSWLLLAAPGCSLAAPGCSWLLLAAPGCSLAAPWLLLAAPWLLLAAPGCSLAAPGCSLAAPGCSWLLLGAPGCSWLLLLAAPGCSWLLPGCSWLCSWLLLAAPLFPKVKG